MKKIFLTCVFYITMLVGFTQSLAPEFGVFTQRDIDLKVCSFDKEADAVVLFDIANTDYDDEYRMITERRIRFKILKERGKERADIHIPFYSKNDFEFITNIDAVIYSYNDQNKPIQTALDRKSVYRRKINSLYSEMVITLPNVKVGSIIEYKYKSAMKSYAGLEEWIFQKEMPVLMSSYMLNILPNYEFAYVVSKSPFLNIDIKPDIPNGKISFQMKQIPGFRDEAFMDARKDYLQRVEFQLSGHNSYYGKRTFSTTWNQVGKELAEEPAFGAQVMKNLSSTDDLNGKVQMAASQAEKIKIIYEYVRSAMLWNNIYSKYAVEGVKGAWEKKTGSSGDINLILLNLLKSYQLDAYPLLVAERHYGRVDTTYPFKEQFNKVVAYVKTAGKIYILDATDRITPFDIIPYDLLNTNAFLVDRKNSLLLYLSDTIHKQKNVISIHASIDAEGITKGAASVCSYDYAKLDRVMEYKKDQNKYRNAFVETYNGVTIDSFSVSGMDNDSLPFLQNLQFVQTASKTGNLYLYTSNLFAGLDKNPFLSDQRFSKINFGCPYSYHIHQAVQVKDKLKIESLPKSITLISQDKSMTMVRKITVEGDQIFLSMQIEINRSVYVPEEYDMVRGFYNKMIELINEPVVLKMD
jgi:hypothetical protein